MSTKNLTKLGTFTERFCYIIEYIKDKHSVNQSRIAEQIRLSTAALSKLKKGNSKTARGTTLAALQAKYGVNPDWLVHGEGEPFLSDPGDRRIIVSRGKREPVFPKELEVNEIVERIQANSKKMFLHASLAMIEEDENNKKIERLKAERSQFPERIDSIDAEIERVRTDNEKLLDPVSSVLIDAYEQLEKFSALLGIDIHQELGEAQKRQSNDAMKQDTDDD